MTAAAGRARGMALSEDHVVHAATGADREDLQASVNFALRTVIAAAGPMSGLPGGTIVLGEPAAVTTGRAVAGERVGDV